MAWGIAPSIGLAVSLVLATTAYGDWWSSPDPGFGVHGVVVTQVVPGAANAATSIALEPGGDVLVGGSAGPGQAALGGSTEGFLARLLRDGRLDPSFGGSGSVRPAGLASVNEIKPAYSGDVLALGGSLMLLEHSGRAVSAFGINGAALMPPGFAPSRFAVEQDRSIALVGSVTGSGGVSEPAVARLTAAGRPDPSFGSDGLAVLPPPTDGEGEKLKSVTPGGLVVQPNGGIVLTLWGYEPRHSVPASVLERVSSGGRPDTGFGLNGQTSIGRETVGMYDPLLAPGGDVLMALGYFGAGGHDEAFVVWRWSEAGLAFQEQTGGFPNGDPVGGFVALPDGLYLLLGRSGSGTEAGRRKASFVKVGLDHLETSFVWTPSELELPNGAIDPEGLVAAQPDGELILAGSAPMTNGLQGIFLERLRGVSIPAAVSLPPHLIRRGPRSVTLRLSCTSARSCQGLAELSISVKPTVRYAVSKAFTIARGAAKNVTLTFTRAGRRKFSKRARTRVTLTVILNDGPQRSARIVLPGRR